MSERAAVLQVSPEASILKRYSPAIAFMMIPGVGIMTWEDAQKRIAWGTLFLFGIGISLGSAIISTRAGIRPAKAIAPLFGLSAAPALLVALTLAAFPIVIHPGFAGATALASVSRKGGSDNDHAHSCRGSSPPRRPFYF